MNENDLSELDQAQLNDERLRRMKTLMRQLYREEFEAKKYKLPPIKGKTLILFVSFVSIIIFGVTTLYNYNRFVTLEEHILSAKGHVEVSMQHRANLFSNLFNLALNHADIEREVFHYVADARTALRGEVGQGKGAMAEEVAGNASPSAKVPTASALGEGALARFPDTISRLLAIVEQYPDIKSSETYQQLMEKLVLIETKVVDRRDEANEAIRVFNTLISTFPWYVLSKATGFSRYDYYKFNTRDTLLSVDVFDRLLPLPDTFDTSPRALPVPARTGNVSSSQPLPVPASPGNEDTEP